MYLRTGTHELRPLSQKKTPPLPLRKNINNFHLYIFPDENLKTTKHTLKGPEDKKRQQQPCQHKNLGCHINVKSISVT